VIQPEQQIEVEMTGAHPDETGPPKAEFGSIEEAFLALETPLLGYALRLTKEPAMAQDIVQEAFMRLHSQFETVQDPRRWTYRTVHNLALNQIRRDSKVVPLHPSENAGENPETETADPRLLPDEEITRIENIGLVRLSLNTLEDRSRELVRLKFNDDLSYKEISAKTGLTVGNVGYLLHHALKAMEADLTKRGVIS
jgi:RNA polymerase sigma factor (sigma-70 family)